MQSSSRISRSLSLRLLAAALAGALGGCDGGDLINPHYRPVSGYAILSPFALSSANEEVFSRNIGAMPLLTVDLPNKKNEEPTVHSLIDDINSFTGNSSTQPATRPGARIATVRPEDALPVPPPMRVVEVIKPTDEVTITHADDRVILVVTSPGGDGAAILERTGENWPAQVQIDLLTSADRPLKGDVSLNVFELPGGDQRIPIKTTPAKALATYQVAIPAFVRGPRILIQWTTPAH